MEVEAERAPTNATGELGTNARAKGCAHQPIMLARDAATVEIKAVHASTHAPGVIGAYAIAKEHAL